MKFLSLLLLFASHAAAISIPTSTRKLYNAGKKHSASALAIPAFAASIAVPSSLGFIKREYGVSYGYGGAIAAAGLLMLRSVPPSSTLAVYHAALHVIYGFRLCLFLLYRELSIPSFREMRNKIEQKSPKTRIERTPFILQCAFLYAMMSCPLLLTSSLPQPPVGTMADTTMKALLGIATSGLLCQIFGDTHKSIAKARGVSLVTEGLFSVLRHPNYTGEAILWSFSTAAGLFMAFTATSKTLSVHVLSFLSILGALGINFILAMANTNLERRQKEKYGGTQEYLTWKKKAFKGFTIPGIVI